MSSSISSLIKYFGTQARTARALGVSQATISYWLSGAQKISPEKAFLAELMTEGSIRASSLCALLAQVEARHKVSESSMNIADSALGPNGSVCLSSTQQVQP